jgi:hypothetical protein
MYRSRRVRFADTAELGGGLRRWRRRATLTALWPPSAVSWRSMEDKWSEVWSQFFGTLLAAS